MNEAILKKALARYATPLYVFDADVLKKRVSFLKHHLPDRVKLCYAVKANPFIVKELCPIVDRFELCSPGEIAICQKLHLPANQFVVSGVYKEASYMKQLFFGEGRNSVYTIESLEQFSLLYELAKEANEPISVLIRMTSGNQFGLDAAQAERLIAEYARDPMLRLKGMQYYSGTQKTSIKRLKRELECVDAFLDKMRLQYGYQAEELEFGPGFPVSYFQGDSFEEEAFIEQFSMLLSEMHFQGSVILELGRSIAAECGTYLTKVVDVKTNAGQNYAIVDGGIHQMVYYGQSMAMKQPKIKLLSKHKGEPPSKWNICGSLCTINDILVKQISLPDLQIGDVLAFERTGAYSMTEGISLFLSRDLPAVALVNEEGSCILLRNHIPVNDWNTPNNS